MATEVSCEDGSDEQTRVEEAGQTYITASLRESRIEGTCVSSHTRTMSSGPDEVSSHEGIVDPELDGLHRPADHVDLPHKRWRPARSSTRQQVQYGREGVGRAVELLWRDGRGGCRR